MELFVSSDYEMPAFFIRSATIYDNTDLLACNIRKSGIVEDMSTTIGLNTILFRAANLDSQKLI